MSSIGTLSALAMRAYWRGLIIAVGLVALLAPSIGPLVDHHFAERQHDHAHIYFGSNAPDHVHPYDVAHIHHLINSSVAQTPSEQTVFLTSNDATGSGGVSVSAVSTDVEIAFPNQGDANPILAFSDRETPLAENFVALPKKPPRA